MFLFHFAVHFCVSWFCLPRMQSVSLAGKKGSLSHSQLYLLFAVKRKGPVIMLRPCWWWPTAFRQVAGLCGFNWAVCPGLEMYVLCHFWLHFYIAQLVQGCAACTAAHIWVGYSRFLRASDVAMGFCGAACCLNADAGVLQSGRTFAWLSYSLSPGNALWGCESNTSRLSPLTFEVCSQTEDDQLDKAKLKSGWTLGKRNFFTKPYLFRQMLHWMVWNDCQQICKRSTKWEMSQSQWSSSADTFEGL